MCLRLNDYVRSIEIRYLFSSFGMDWKSLPQNRTKTKEIHLQVTLDDVFLHVVLSEAEKQNSYISTHYFVNSFGAINF